MKLKSGFSLLLFAVALLWGAKAWAQEGTANVTGRVTDPGGAAIVGGKVEALNNETNVVYRAESNADGIYTLRVLPPGRYKITTTKEGFETLIRPDVVLHVAENVTLDLGMSVGTVTESVTVQGGAPQVNISDGTLGGLVEAHEVADLPLNGRNYITLTLIQPGVEANTNINQTGPFVGTFYATNGATIRSNNFTLDGAILQDVTSGTTATLSGRTLGIDGIEEYRVITSNFEAEYGLVMGSQQVMVSKRGTNSFHGSVFEYFRNSVLDAADRFYVPTAASGHRRIPEYQRNNYGASFGGPIRRDKTFFFATYEGLHEKVGTTINNAVPAAGCHAAAGAVVTKALCPDLQAASQTVVNSAALNFLALFPLPNAYRNSSSTVMDAYVTSFPQPDAANFGQIRVDNVFNDKDSAFVRYNIINDYQVVAVNFPQYFVNPRYNRNQYTTLSESHIFSKSVLNTATLSYSRTLSSRLSPTPDNLINANYSLIAGYAFGQINITGYPTMGPNNNGAGPTNGTGSIYVQNLYTFADDLSYQLGRHSLKFGTLINHFDQNMTFGNRNGAVNFASIDKVLQGLPANYSAVTPGSNINRTYETLTTGFYAQDDWRALTRLTLNLGLRYEPAPIYFRETHGYSAVLRNITDTSFTVGPLFENPTFMNISPRIGFAWDVFGNGKTSIHGGGNIGYDVAPLAIPIIGLQVATPPFASTSTVNNPTTPLTLPLSFASAGVAESVATTDYHLKQSRMYADNLTVEQQLPFKTVVSVSYAGSRGVHLEGTREGNPNNPAGYINGLPYWPTTGTQKYLAAQYGDTAFANIQIMDTNHDSNFNALEVSAVRQMAKGLQFQLAYTWGKLLDDTQGTKGDDIYTSGYPANPFYGTRYDYGPAGFNVPHTIAVNGIYNFPNPKSHGLIGTLGSGWGTSGIFLHHTGLPFTPVDSVERSNSGVAGGSSGFGGIDRPNWNPAFSGKVIQGGIAHYFNPAAFVLQPAGFLGNVSRDCLYGPSYTDLDMAFKKDTKFGLLGDAGNIQFRAEFFNILNHPNLFQPNPAVFAGTLSDVTENPLSTAGTITQTASNARQIEFSLRFSF